MVGQTLLCRIDADLPVKSTQISVIVRPYYLPPSLWLKVDEIARVSITRATQRYCRNDTRSAGSILIPLARDFPRPRRTRPNAFKRGLC